MQIKYIIERMQTILDYIDSKAGKKETIENFIQYLNNVAIGEQLLPDKIIELLNLIDLSKITSEQGFFSEFVKTENLPEEINRTVIFYLIKDQQTSCWHSLDTTETWHWLAGCDITISILSKDKINEFVLNAQNPCLTLEKGTLFGARNNLTAAKDRDNFGLVTCECIPGFTPSLYSNPTKEQLQILSCLYKKDDEKRSTIEKLIPKVQLKEFNELKPATSSKFFLADNPIKKESGQNFIAKSSLSS
ncbi:cupin domain-containing protein [Rickettsiella endosymbiont of Dermanyssus gallinae]|uniref:cupin domain-containing protein n=1 Tax=Rickettsiella endosymbiont of Dermanyssus gallinae TaxID=2856608 RepID=UPI001C528E32|nr:cupin domain-containing protein [Rickettsiella endosymbiont of Dermanyssus gallinae]